MNILHRFLGIAIVGIVTGFGFCAPVQAESLRCNGNFTSVGDSRASVLLRCGEPLLRDAFCEPKYYYDPARLVYLPVLLPNGVAACDQVEDWIYDRGQGYMLATVRFRNGRVDTISYSRTP